MVTPPSFAELTLRVGEVRSADGEILTEQFLAVCSQVLPIIGATQIAFVLIGNTLFYHFADALGIVSPQLAFWCLSGTSSDVNLARTIHLQEVNGPDCAFG
jgi:hypothetical protein